VPRRAHALNRIQPARYFPVKPTPFRFQAGLLPFGTDLGNGEVERQFFQVDSEREHYLSEKRRVRPERHHLLERDEDERRVHQRVLPWIRATLEHEHPDLFAPAPPTYGEIAAAVQEDLVVLHRRRDGSNAAIMVDVRFPSDWDPDRIVGTDFRFIHGPVPDFADTTAQADSMVAAMIDRGPYVRFVWTLKPDDHLDHHPIDGRHETWHADREGFLRVERQITVPFADVGAALFIIRTYLYPFSRLTAEQRRRLRQAVQSMPPEAARYKSFVADKSLILQLLER
jgi:dimethylamine monooxygenase subunit A